MKKELFRQFTSNGHNFVFFAGGETPSQAPQNEFEQQAAELNKKFDDALGDDFTQEQFEDFLRKEKVDTPFTATMNQPGWTAKGHYIHSVLIKEHGVGDAEAMRVAVDRVKAGEVVLADSSKSAVKTAQSEGEGMFDKVGRWFSGEMSPEEKGERLAFLTSLIDEFDQYAAKEDLNSLFSKYGVDAPSMSAQQHFAKMGLPTYKEQVIAHIYHAKFTASKKENNQMLASIQQLRKDQGVTSLDY